MLKPCIKGLDRERFSLSPMCISYLKWQTVDKIIPISWIIPMHMICSHASQLNVTPRTAVAWIRLLIETCLTSSMVIIGILRTVIMIFRANNGFQLMN